MMLPSIAQTYQYVFVILIPLVTYYFLVYFTGVPMAEQSSLQKRGKEYKDYQDSTNMFFPWFSRNI